jgi:hypothetical protein
METPRGCTHVQLANPLDYDQKPTFLKLEFDFLGPESGQEYYCWCIWHQGTWRKDYGYQTPGDSSRFIPISEFKLSEEK